METGIEFAWVFQSLKKALVEDFINWFIAGRSGICIREKDGSSHFHFGHGVDGEY
ncbi:hypothetical protein [Lacticaseibacillus pantheris]|uniref:hypothetical protein n=1 Tax=Lacticaseibacillus pantheris TaxID=171523 RepID=UPI000B1BEB11|nr:hypothetical protein [Lacticaseibacillus pantheris]